MTSLQRHPGLAVALTAWRLYEATGENVHLAVLDGATPETSAALYVGRLTGSDSIPTLSRMGGRHSPTRATAPAMLLVTESAMERASAP